MTPDKNRSLYRSFAAVLLTGAASPMMSVACADDLGTVVRSQDGGAEQHILNLRDVDLLVLIDDIASMTGYTFVVHPSVRGKVTVSSQTPLSSDEVFKVFLSTLRVHGFAAVPVSGGAYRIVPEQSASSDAQVGRSAAGDQFETAVIQLNNFDAVEAAKMIKPLTNSQGQVSTSARSNSVVVVDYASNLDRVRRVLDELDQDQSSLITISLNNMSAGEMAKIVNGIASGDNAGFKFEVGALAVDSNNSVVLRGAAADVERVTEIVRGLDQESRSPTETLKVFSLAHAQAKELAPILEQLATGMKEAMAPSGGAIGKPTIVVHEATNALVVNADARILSQIERVVSELDVRRAQVLVEALIVELSDDAAKELGVQFVLAGNDDTSLPLTVTNFSRSTPNILSLAGALATGGSDVSGTSTLQEAAISSLLSANGALFGFGAANSDGSVFGAIVNAVEDDTASNLLSTPSVLTLDNETASFIVGQEIPITTGETLSANNANPFRTVERENIGVQLEVTPQIGDGDSVKLYLRQEVSSIFGPISSSSADLITNKREVTSTVLADDGEIIVLGGLIQEQEDVSVSKVPLLGDIPGLGRLFQSRARSKTRKNLMVFLRPTVVRDTEDMRGATMRKWNYMRGEQQELTGNSPTLDDFVKDVLGVDMED